MKRPKAKPGHGIPVCEPGRRSDVLRDLQMSVNELVLAREEMAAVPTNLGKHARDKALVEPLSRVSLVRRFCAQILDRYGWEAASVVE